MDTASDLTLFLWPEGFFPKQIVYHLLLKGVIESPQQLYEGNTNDPRLKIRLSFFNRKSIQDANPEDPKPPGKSSPCLRVVGAEPGAPRWIHESSSIRLFFEEFYSNRPTMTSATILDRALMNDIQGTIYQVFNDFNYYIKNAAPVTTSWSGMRNEDRSLAVAKHARDAMVRSLLKVQDWATQSLEGEGWLTPGLQHPGLNDVILAGGARYLELGYSFDMFEDERLKHLRNWYVRFKQQVWWEELEERGRLHEGLIHPADCREI